MKTKKNLMFRLTIVSFALNIVSIFLSILNQSQEKTADMEEIAYQKYKALIDTGNLINSRDPLVEGLSSFPSYILT
jgi:hypothetical protein